MSKKHSLENSTWFIKQSWRDRGVALVLAHPDDEVLYWKLLECLC